MTETDSESPTALDRPHSWVGVIVKSTILFLLFVVVCLSLQQVLVADLLSEWDYFPNYYLLQTMLDNLEHGRVISYDHKWFAGYPIFVYYGFLPFYIMAQAHLLVIEPTLGDSIRTLALSLNIFLYIIPLLQLAAFGLLGRGVLGKGYGFWTVLVGFLCLFEGGYYILSPFNIFTNVFFGHLASAFALVFLCAAMGTLGMVCRGGNRWIWGIPSALLIAAVICSHSLTAVFLALYGLFLIGWHRKEHALALIAIFSSGFLLSLPWSIEILHYYWVSRAEPVGPTEVDPLVSLFPRINILKLCLTYWTEEAWLNIPFSGLLLIPACIVGVASLASRRQYFLLGAFAIFLIVLPRDFLYRLTFLPLHYYRFIAPLFFLFVPICAFGLARIFYWSIARRWLVAKTLFTSAFTLAFLLASASALRVDYRGGYTPFPWLRTAYDMAGNACGYLDNRIFPTPIVSYRAFQDVQEVMAYFKRNPPEGRIAVQQSIEERRRIATPFALHTLLPLLDNREIIPGLLVESSPAAPLQIALLGSLGFGMIWGDNAGQTQDGGLQMEIPEMIDAIRHYGASHLVLTAEVAKENVIEDGLDMVDEVLKNNSYTVYRIRDVPSRITELGFAPFLFVEAGGISFKQFGPQYFFSRYGRAAPVLYHHGGLADLEPGEREKLGGLIVSLPAWRPIEDREQIEPWLKYNLPLVVLGPNMSGGVRTETPLLVIPVERPQRIFRSGLVENRLWRFMGEPGIYSVPAENLTYSRHQIAFEMKGPTLLRFGFYPRWEESEGRHVYQTTSGLMFLFADGETTLAFR